jgi:hypothetical protein
MDPQEPAEQSPTSPSTPISPPFWHSEGQEPPAPADGAGGRRASTPGGIRLEDHTDEDSERGRACWAKSVAVRDHVVVGSGLGAYVVYNCVVETANVGARRRGASVADFASGGPHYRPQEVRPHAFPLNAGSSITGTRNSTP